MNIEVIKTIYEGPLSRVELVESSGIKRVRKTVHPDFAIEFDRQNFINNYLKSTRVPKMFEMVKNDDGSVSCIMEYLE